MWITLRIRSILIRFWNFPMTGNTLELRTVTGGGAHIPELGFVMLGSPGKSYIDKSRNWEFMELNCDLNGINWLETLIGKFNCSGIGIGFR